MVGALADGVTGGVHRQVDTCLFSFILLRREVPLIKMRGTNQEGSYEQRKETFKHEERWPYLVHLEFY